VAAFSPALPFHPTWGYPRCSPSCENELRVTSVALPLGTLVDPHRALLAAAALGRGSSKRGAREASACDTGCGTPRLFLVEDNAADVDLVRDALSALPFKVDVSSAIDGEEALVVLREAAQRGVLPDVIFLDLNLPRMSGHAVLAQLRTIPALRDVPVVVLTSSSASAESDGSSALHADDFVTKPMDVYEYFRVVQAAARRWLRIS
jgi:two-component system, chemotaxis family, response regulator Rcp1